MQPDIKILAGLLIDYYEAGECECKAARYISGPLSGKKCLRCRLWEQIGNLPEAHFNELRKEIE